MLANQFCRWFCSYPYERCHCRWVHQIRLANPGADVECIDILQTLQSYEKKNISAKFPNTTKRNKIGNAFIAADGCTKIKWKRTKKNKNEKCASKRKRRGNKNVYDLFLHICWIKIIIWRQVVVVIWRMIVIRRSDTIVVIFIRLSWWVHIFNCACCNLVAMLGTIVNATAPLR